MYIYIYKYMFICIFLYIYLYFFMYLFIYIYIYIWLFIHFISAFPMLTCLCIKEWVHIFSTVRILTFTKIRSFWCRYTNLKFWVENWISWTRLNFHVLGSATFNITAQVRMSIISWRIFSTYCTNIPIGDI